MSVQEINQDNFEEIVTKSDKPIVMDTSASWCGPCRMMEPVFNELSEEMTDIVFAKLDIEANRELASKFHITAIPCIIIFNKGEEVDRIIGFKQKQDLKQSIEAILGGLK